MKLNSNWTLYYRRHTGESFSKNLLKKCQKFDNVSLPTSFELELYKNKVLGEPYYSTNIWDYQKYEDYDQFYVCKFSSNKTNEILRLHGIDTIANIYVNGQLIGKTNNMFMSYDFKLNNLKKENELVIHVLPTLLEGQKFKIPENCYAAKYNYESLYIRKSPYSFGWDIFPRAILGGIYKEIELLEEEPVVKNFFINTAEFSKKLVKLEFNIEFYNENKKYDFVIKGNCKDSKFETSNNFVYIENPYLWNIRGYGEPNLYSITLEIYFENQLVEKKELHYGIRKVELKKSSVVEENGCFEFHINDQKVFLLGTNWVPTEAIKHIDDERALKALDMIEDLNCNAIRIWGGGTYETDFLYDECDKRGIFIWQDFMMGCALYPQDEYFQGLIKEEATYIVKKLKNHPSICLFAGDNENDVCAVFWTETKHDPNKNILTRKTLKEVVEEIDKDRPYLPSSPYIDEYAFDHIDMPLPEDHRWGPRDYFKGEYYRSGECYFASETGYHAMPNYESLVKFLEKPWPLFIDEIEYKENSRNLVQTIRPTKEYLCHAVSVKDEYDSPYSFRIRLMFDQVRTLFKDDITTLDDFIIASQISQGEALKYFVERLRKDYKRNGGIIWWNILDGWPQISDSVVDYYFSRKQAYYYLKNSQQTDLLFMDEDEGLKLYFSSHNCESHKYEYEIIDAYKDEIIDKGEFVSTPFSSFMVKQFNIEEKTLLIIKYKNELGEQFINHFHTNVIDIDFMKYKEAMIKYELIK